MEKKSAVVETALAAWTDIRFVTGPERHCIAARQYTAGNLATLPRSERPVRRHTIRW
jgi:hypothetical protein